MHLVMFDVDGTLVDSAGFDGELYADAVHSVLKVDVDRTWSSYEHVTDSGVLAELLPLTRVDGDRTELAAQVKRRFIELVRDYLARQPSAANEIAGARALVEGLRTTLGRATYFGDGPWDQRASALLGYDFIAVGKAVDHPVAFADFRDDVAILRHLGVAEGAR
jgi:beta-phosphoglucomutase-like phosphatase (HAD superfamily)